MQDEDPSGMDAINEVPICASCGSERVVRDAWACWNREAGLWELEHAYDCVYCHQCECEVKLQWIRPDLPTNGRIRELNDAFRTLRYGRGTVVITNGISALGDEAVKAIMTQIRTFDAFSEENDPWGEHDFGAFQHDGEKIFWKIDHYDLNQQAHSPNAANAAVTHRVLTVMLASEY